jgi:hypothetical protein
MMRIVVLFVLAILPAAAAELSYSSKFLKVALSSAQPAFETLAVDSLGKGKLSANLLHAPAPPDRSYGVRRAGAASEYLLGAVPVWSVEVSEKQLRLRSSWSEQAAPRALEISIDPHVSHATLLGRVNEDGSVRLPALLHMPDHGTLRVRAAAGSNLSLPYDASRGKEGYWVKIAFPPATRTMPQVEYVLDVVNIHPGPAAIEQDPRFDGYRRNFISILQLNPRFKLLANHSASDPAPLTYFQYALVAARTPPLAEGLRATDLLRDTLDRYLAGAKGFGMRGYLDVAPEKDHYPYDSLDTFPSLVISVGEYVRATNDTAWLEKNYKGIEAWAGRILAYDSDGDGLMEYPVSGNSGSWPEAIKFRPANWWDAIGFGHKDAYSNALAYRALMDMAEMAQRTEQGARSREYRAKAERLRKTYVPTFFNPATGVLAGWKSADGKLHDYYFTFLQGMAISLGLVPPDQANKIMDRLLAKMKEVGYNRFEFGLPGNLIPVRSEDYITKHHRWGGSLKEDGSDGFQIYENGGASACHVYWTLQALYQLGRHAEADRILFPLLEGFEKGNFQGFGPNGLTYDWRAWDGTPHGYEGLLVDNFLALLAVHTGWAKQ